MDIPLVSVIMPAYNSEEYISASINSVINQTYQNWELIVIDDGSKDRTIECIRNLQKGDSRICLYKNEHNIGVSKTRNKGVKIAKGEWIAFLDSDDMWSPLKLHNQLAFADGRNAEFTFTASSFIDEVGKAWAWIMEVPEVINYKELLRHNVISCSSVLMKKECIGNHIMKCDEMHEDFAMWLDILKNGKKRTESTNRC